VVSNLVHNAIKFTPQGGLITVQGSEFRAPTALGSGSDPGRATRNPHLATLPDGDWVLISVQDTGIGIPADDLDRIFERFYKADRARSGGGTGLGLSIAKHIVQGHGGQIWVESLEGTGSTFYFVLPVA
jgi:two-component system phosphate regulon sensor histidine kinase PhoR